ncbi:MAG: hypothetical protein EB020_02320 [Proteobacteria bacterium]|nr:hypothetical protein [Pseudomonadota bacterium]NDE75601.1 hypothetical protein [Pseudomonadota bacterium]
MWRTRHPTAGHRGIFVALIVRRPVRQDTPPTRVREADRPASRATTAVSGTLTPHALHHYPG